jgi:hypothetical protein
VFQALSKIPFSANSSTTERFTFYPDFVDTSAHRTEFEATVQAALAPFECAGPGFQKDRFDDDGVGRLAVESCDSRSRTVVEPRGSF